MLKKLLNNKSLSYFTIISIFLFSCETNDIVTLGCLDPTANNYNPLASQDDGSCDYCIYGCMDPNAINYNSLATCDDGSCTGEALEIAGVIDFSLGTTAGKAIHLRVLADIGDLSTYGVGVANNGGGTDGIEITFNSISVSAGDDILIARDDFLIGEYFSTCISSFEYVFQDDLVNQNGDDAVELFKGSDVIETFGDINIDGTATVWEYTDSWAYKDASGSATFGSGNWIFGGINCTDGTATIFESSCLYPLCQ